MTVTGKDIICMFQSNFYTKKGTITSVQGQDGDRKRSDELSGFQRIMGAFLAVL